MSLSDLLHPRPPSLCSPWGPLSPFTAERRVISKIQRLWRGDHSPFSGSSFYRHGPNAYPVFLSPQHGSRRQDSYSLQAKTTSHLPVSRNLPCYNPPSDRLPGKAAAESQGCQTLTSQKKKSGWQDAQLNLCQQCYHRCSSQDKTERKKDMTQAHSAKPCPN